jgi:hypothetical protein
MAASDILSLLLGTNANSIPQQVVDANQEVMAQMYDSVAPFSLGTHTGRKVDKKEALAHIGAVGANVCTFFHRCNSWLLTCHCACT